MIIQNNKKSISYLNEKTAKIHTDKFVKVTQPGEIIYGFGLEAEQDFSYWKIKVPKGRIKSEKFD